VLFVSHQLSGRAASFAVAVCQCISFSPHLPTGLFKLKYINNDFAISLSLQTEKLNIDSPHGEKELQGRNYLFSLFFTAPKLFLLSHFTSGICGYFDFNGFCCL